MTTLKSVSAPEFSFLATRHCVAGAALAVLLMCLGTVPAEAVEVEPMTLNETVQKSDAIVVGHLVKSESRWGSHERRYIVTDHTFRIADAILAKDYAPPGGEVTLTFWGGTIGDETQEIAGAPALEVDHDYVLMIAPNREEAGLTPLVGLYHGLFPIVEDKQTGARQVVDAQGAPLLIDQNGRIVASDLIDEADQIKQRGVTLDQFVEAIREELKRRGENSGEKEAPGIPPEETARPKIQGDRERDQPTTPHDEALAPERQAEATPRSNTSPKYKFSGVPDLPISVNRLDTSSSFSPIDQYCMSNWNHFSRNVFKVYTRRLEWRWRNGVFDLAGFPNDQDMRREFGQPWDSNTLGICFQRKSSGKIIEADIALNPSFTWTLNDESVYDGGSGKSFRRTMTHELGHMWGLEHNFESLSVMNYSPSVYRAFSLPFMDDAEAIRAANSANKVETRDLGIYLFYSAGTKDWRDTTYPTSVKAGSSFTVNNYHLENAGTQVEQTPKVEWYLTNSRNFSDGYYYIGATQYPKLDKFSSFRHGTVGRTLNVPSNVPAGQYYLAAFIRGDESVSWSDFPFDNSRAFSRKKIRITNP